MRFLHSIQVDGMLNNLVISEYEIFSISVISYLYSAASYVHCMVRRIGRYHHTTDIDGIIYYLQDTYIDFEYSVNIMLQVKFITNNIHTSIITLFDNQSKEILDDHTSWFLGSPIT